jgi:hypothetical protein
VVGWRRRGEAAPPASEPGAIEPRSPVLTILLASVLVLVDASAFGLSVSRPVTGTDPMSIWTARAVLIHERGDLDSRELERATFYPPLIPSGLAWMLGSLGERDYVRIKLLNPCLLVALQLLVMRALRRRVAAWILLAGNLLLTGSLVALSCVWEPLADLALAVYTVLAAVMLLGVREGDARARALVVVAVLGGFLSRPEGLPAAAGILALLAWLWPRRTAGLSFAVIASALAVAVLLIMVWRFKGYEPFGAPQGFASDARASTARIRDNTAYILGYFLQRLELFDLWGYVWLLPCAVLVWRARAVARDREACLMLVLTLWIAFVHYVSYVLYPGEVRQHLPLSGDRVPYRFTFPFVLAAMLALRRRPADPEAEVAEK